MSIQRQRLGYSSSSPNLNLFQTLNYLIDKRQLLLLLVIRDLKSRYRRSFLGIIWTLINPILSSLVLWVVFVSVFKSRLSDGTQFAPYLLAGVITITFFNQGFLQGAEAISNSGALFLKVRTNPQLFTIASVLSNAVNFGFGLIALGIVSLASGAEISTKFPLVFFVCVCLIMLTTGLGLLFGNLFVKYDDLKYIVTVLLQLLVYLTPVFYPKEMLGQSTRFMITLNPLTSYLDIFRFVFNGTEVATTFDWAYMFGSSILSLLIGMYVFRKTWANTVVML